MNKHQQHNNDQLPDTSVFHLSQQAQLWFQLWKHPRQVQQLPDDWQYISVDLDTSNWFWDLHDRLNQLLVQLQHLLANNTQNRFWLGIFDYQAAVLNTALSKSQAQHHVTVCWACEDAAELLMLQLLMPDLQQLLDQHTS